MGTQQLSSFKGRKNEFSLKIAQTKKTLLLEIKEIIKSLFYIGRPVGVNVSKLI